MLSEKLQKFGLSEKEAVVYICLLELGTSSVSDIANKASLNRSTTYVILESLAKFGLVSISTREKIRLYRPVSPERITQIAEESVKKYNELVEISYDLLPELKSLYSELGPKPKVQFFQGIEGVRNAYEDTLTSTQTILAYASVENIQEAIPEYYKRRAVKNIHTRAIFPDTHEAYIRVKANDEECREAYLVPKEQYAFSPEINVYDNKIVFMSLLEKFALIIESKELAGAFKKVFELSWQEAKRLDTKIHQNHN